MNEDKNKLEKELNFLKIENKLLNKMVTDTQNDLKKAVNKKRNRNFIQLYKDQAIELRRLSEKNPVALQLLLLFGEVMDKQNAVVISFKSLETITSKSRSTLSRAVNVLTEERFIKIIKVGNVNAYVVNSNVFWTADANSKDKISVFSATVVATSGEQDPAYLENWDNIKMKQMPLLSQKEDLSLIERKEEQDEMF